MSKISKHIRENKSDFTAVQSTHTGKPEAVNHPAHYQSKTGLEAIDVIEAFELDFNLGNAAKYILRCGKKDAAVQELRKAIWYIEREINSIEESKGTLNGNDD